MLGNAEAITTIAGGTHKRPVNQRILGADRTVVRKRTSFMPGHSEHADFLINVFDRYSQLPNPTLMQGIDPDSLGTPEEETMAAAHLVTATPEERQTGIYRVLLAGLKVIYTLPRPASALPVY
jgi:hypothetical protein